MAENMCPFRFQNESRLHSKRIGKDIVVGGVGQPVKDSHNIRKKKWLFPHFTKKVSTTFVLVEMDGFRDFN